MNNVSKHVNIPIFIPHLACPYKCIFCDQQIISNQRQVPKPEDLKGIIEKHLTTISNDTEIEVAFFGGSFTAIDLDLQKEYLQAVKPYIDTGKIKYVRLSTRPDCIDSERLKLLADYGVKVIELGVQSLVNEVLQKSGRSYTVEQVVKASNLIKAADFQLGIQLMPGLPGDSGARNLITTKKTIEINPDMVRIYPTVVLANTPLAVMLEKGIYQDLSVDTAIDMCLEMFLRFQLQGIKVIRMGLQNGLDLQNTDNIKGGAFHPAFGELVEQKIFLKQTLMLLNKYEYLKTKAKEINFYVQERDLSKFIGLKKRNINYLEAYLSTKKISIKTLDTLERDWVGISLQDKKDPDLRLSRQDFLRFYLQ